jgi:hypothetical protein
MLKKDYHRFNEKDAGNSLQAIHFIPTPCLDIPYRYLPFSPHERRVIMVLAISLHTIILPKYQKFCLSPDTYNNTFVIY